MNAQLGWGIAVVIIAGVVNGSFAVPMKRMPSWRWENSWLMFAISGLVIFPWLIAYGTVPHLASVYSAASWPTLEKVLLLSLIHI